MGRIMLAAVVCALCLKVRLFGPLTYSDIIIPVIFLSLKQWEVCVEATNPAPQVFPVPLVVGYCLAWICENRLIKYTFVLTINFLLIYSEYGLFMGLVTPVVFGLDCYLGTDPSRSRRFRMFAP
jgi:hypothetical protein